VGAACAYYLVQEGLEVCLMDSGFAGGGTTAAGMGHIAVMDESEAQFALTAYSRQLWAELADEFGSRWENDTCGTLWVAADEEELAHVSAKASFLRERGVQAIEMTAADVAREEPALRPGLAGGLQVPDDRVIYPPAATRWLVDQAVAGGAELRENCTVRDLGSNNGEVLTDRGTVFADHVVNAAGAEAARLTPEIPIEPRKGHLVITDRYPRFCRHQLVELGYLKSAHTMTAESVAFNVQPRRTGQLLIGSSRELVGWDRSINREIVGQMLDRAREYMPGLADLYALRVWVGFRPAIADHLPLIGRWPLGRSLWIAAGHEGLGITMALATGRLLADQIVGRPAAIDVLPYEPTRVLS
jgi:glycine/D-amino acid oxidase-like deaminating enzyme